MSDTSGENLFDYIDSPEEEVIEVKMDESDKPFMEGICPKCLDTGFIHTVKDGILGLAFQVSGQDSVGQPIKRLLVCGCGFKPVSY